MKTILEDIRQRLRRGEYRNEEHVRICIVARVLEALGWNIWDPTQVNAECVTVPQEDRTKVDFALSSRPRYPDIFIEVKPVGQVQGQLEKVERQLRDYNRDHSARFSVITDGQRWWLYYALTAGEFRDKRFATIDLLDPSQSLENTETLLRKYLGKSNIDSGTAEESAKNELLVNKKRRAFLECITEARRLVQLPPFPPLPDVMVQLMMNQGFTVDLDEARRLLESLPSQSEAPPPPRSSEIPIQTISSSSRKEMTSTHIQWTDQKPVCFTFLGKQHQVSTFKDILTGLALILYESQPDQFWTRVRQLGNNHYYARQPEGLTTPREIGRSGIWMATNFSAENIKIRCHELLTAFGHRPDDLRVELRR